MPFAQHYRFTMSGCFRGAPQGAADIFERWSIRLNMSNPNTAANLTGLLEEFTLDARAWWARAETGVAQAVTMESTKLARIDANGKYDGTFPGLTGGAVTQEFFQTGGSASSGDPRFPAQIACVVTLNTARRGPTGRGRFFLPGFQGPFVAGYTYAPQATEALEGSTATFLSALNNRPGVDVQAAEVVIASSRGYNTPVTGVSVGIIPDTMRSRRRSLQEQYGTPRPLP